MTEVLEKRFGGSWKVLELFVSKRVGTTFSSMSMTQIPTGT